MFALHLTHGDKEEGRLVLGGYDEEAVETVVNQFKQEVADSVHRVPWDFMPSVSTGIHWFKITSE